MDHRGGGVSAEGEGEEVEHLDALGEAGIHRAGEGVEAVFAETGLEFGWIGDGDLELDLGVLHGWSIRLLGPRCFL